VSKEQIPTTDDQINKNISGKRKRGRSSGPPFPRYALKKALKISESIEKNNAGQPFDRLDLANAMNASPNSSGFRVLIISAARYGITKGGYMSDKIELTSLGSSIVAPTANDNPNACLREALTTPKIFKDVLEKFNKKNIPREDVFKSTIKKDFGVPPEDVDACYNVIMQNIEELNLIQEFKGNKFLNLDKLGEDKEVIVTESRESSEPNTLDIDDLDETSEPEPESKPELQKPKQIFIAHGKNTKPLEQLKEILDQFKVPYKVAIDEANQGRPISQKVSELMRECSSAIFIFTKDEETKDTEGNTIYRPSDNVVFELGGASALYQNKIVIFKEDGVSFGSDFKDLGYISFDTDQLGAKTVDLMKELIGFGLLKVSAT